MMENQMKVLAEQLRCPSGEQGIKLGHNMNMSNLPVIMHGINNLNIQPYDQVLELGYGNGGLLGYIISEAEGIHYTGLEISPTMHQEAIAQNKPYIDAGLARYELFDGNTLPFEASQFDKILTVNTIYFWQNPTLLLENICRVLKTEGHFCLTFCDKKFMQTLPFAAYDFQLYDVADIEQLIKNLPLKVINQVTKTDISLSKSGKLVQRTFISLVLQKLA